MAKTDTTEKQKKEKGLVVSATIPKEQFEAVTKLEGVMGVGRNGVIANIINMWLYSQDWFLEIINKKVKVKNG